MAPRLTLLITALLLSSCGDKEEPTTDDSTVDDTGEVDTSPPEEDCATEGDEDGDGLADCEDSDCATYATCYESDCGDQLDQDADGLVDCWDEDCAEASECEAEGVCDDGVDNDADGANDCGDEDCVGQTGCECTSGALGAETGEGLLRGSSSSWTHDTTGSCGGAGSDTAVGWTFPEDGCFQVDSLASDYDTVMYALDSCGGQELDCNDDVDEGYTQSALHLRGHAGDDAILVIDAFDSSAVGNHYLSITAMNLPFAGDLGQELGAPAASANNEDGASLLALACGPQGGRYESFAWRAPEDGAYVFDTEGSAFDTMLFIFDACMQEELVCNDDVGGPSWSQITREMTAGQQITVVVAGYGGDTGDYVLNIREAEEG